MREDDIYAFPVAGRHSVKGDVSTAGMTLRDWFAGQVIGSLRVGSVGTKYSFEREAKRAYKVANALLKARKL